MDLLLRWSSVGFAACHSPMGSRSAGYRIPSSFTSYVLPKGAPSKGSRITARCFPMHAVLFGFFLGGGGGWWWGGGER
jgi:hypothetical protein